MLLVVVVPLGRTERRSHPSEAGHGEVLGEPVIGWRVQEIIDRDDRRRWRPRRR
jgi:hypothetical protein